MAKAKTPSTGSDKPTQSSAPRAPSDKPSSDKQSPDKRSPSQQTPAKSSSGTSSAASGSGGVPKSKAPAKSATPSEAAKPATQSPRPAAAVKPSKDAPKSAKPANTKPDPATSKTAEPSKTADTVTSAQADSLSDTTKPAVTPETKTKVETGEIGKDKDEGKAATSDDDKPVSSSEAASTQPTKPTAASSASNAAATSKSGSEKRLNVFFPMLLGGIVAGGIGFAVAEYDLLDQFGQQDAPVATDDSAMTDVSDRLTALEQANTDAANQPPDTSATDSALDELRISVADLSDRVDELASRDPVSQQTAAPPPVDTSAFEAELAGLKSSVESQRDEIERLLENALSVEEATRQAAQTAAAQSAIARIVAAVTTGEPFANELDELQANGVDDVPPALVEVAENGVATSASLQDRFSDAARAALAQARANAPDASGGGVAGFFKSQLGARSVIPREGDDPDAILSRAEAAVRDGRLADALAEIDTLPDPAKAPLADWVADAQARQAAQDAIDTLTQRLTAN